MIDRSSLQAALEKPILEDGENFSNDFFDPWEDIIFGVFGSYSSECDDMMIEALEAVRDRTTFDFIEKRGFAAEFILYLLAGHGLTEYGTSPRGGWPELDIADLWQPLIDKWKAYAKAQWSKND